MFLYISVWLKLLNLVNAISLGRHGVSMGINLRQIFP